MEQTQQTTIRVCLLQATYPFNSFHRPFKGSGGELYFPQKVFVTNQEEPSKAPNLNRFLNPITDHPIRIPNGMDPWEEIHIGYFCCEECWVYKEDWFIHHPWSRRSRQKGNIESWKHIWWQWQGHTGCISFSFSLDEIMRQVDYLGNSHFCHAMHEFV